MISTEAETDSDLAEEFNAIIQSATKCIDRGVDPKSGKRGACHVIPPDRRKCFCEAVDLDKYTRAMSGARKET